MQLQTHLGRFLLLAAVLGAYPLQIVVVHCIFVFRTHANCVLSNLLEDKGEPMRCFSIFV